MAQSSAMSRAATWEAVETLRLSEVEQSATGPDDVVVEVGSCGICGSDIHAYVEGAWIAAGRRMGHEYAATVSSVGSEVAGLSVGDRVAINPMVSCGACARCRDGRFRQCGRMAGAGGGFADRVVVSGATVGQQLFILPENLSCIAAAFLEPLSVAVRAVRMAPRRCTSRSRSSASAPSGQCVLQVLLGPWGQRRDCRGH